LDPKAQDRLHHEHSGLTLLRARVWCRPGNQEKPESCPDTHYKIPLFLLYSTAFFGIPGLPVNGPKPLFQSIFGHKRPFSAKSRPERGDKKKAPRPAAGGTYVSAGRALLLVRVYRAFNR
jgi:hypothetical protein